jgi:hypothetical protein
MNSRELTVGCEVFWCRKTGARLLNLSSEVLSVYPWFLRLSQILYRLVQ